MALVLLKRSLNSMFLFCKYYYPKQRQILFSNILQATNKIKTVGHKAGN